MDPNDFAHLLVEIRDIHREHLEEYRRVTGESLELQRQAVKRQEQLGRLYKRVAVVSSLVLIGFVLFLVYLFGGFR